MPDRNRILNVSCIFIHVSSSRKLEQRSCARQIQTEQTVIEIGICRKAAGCTLSRVGDGRQCLRVARSVHTNWIEPKIRDSKTEVFLQMCLHQLSADFHVVVTGCVRKVRSHSPICQSTVL